MTTPLQPLRRRSLRSAAGAAVLALGLSACGSAASETGGQSVAAADAAPTSQPADVDSTESDPGTPVATTPPVQSGDAEAPVDGAQPEAEAPTMVDEQPVAEPDQSDPEPATEVPAPEPAQIVALPAVPVVDLVSGETADLSSLASPGATLVWFWAPH